MSTSTAVAVNDLHSFIAFHYPYKSIFYQLIVYYFVTTEFITGEPAHTTTEEIIDSQLSLQKSDKAIRFQFQLGCTHNMVLQMKPLQSIHSLQMILMIDKVIMH